MRETDKKFSPKKIVIITVCSLFGLTLILSTCVYFKMRSYISKINYVPLEDEEYIDTDSTLYEESEASGSTVASDYDAGNANQTVNMDEDKKASQMDPPAGNSLNQSQEDAAAMAIEQVSDEELRMEEAISRNTSDTTGSLMEDKDVLNVLLIGTDNRVSGKRGLSDSMIIISINSKTERIIATSLLRDIYLKIPGKKNNNRLNTAYASGGTKLLIDTIETNFKIKIDKYASVDFFSFIDIVDQVGGVTLEVTKDELPIVNDYIKEINRILDENKNKDCLKEPGTQLLNGKQALGYTRVRYVGTDFGRTARQRKVLELIFDKVNPMKMNELGDLLEVVLPQVTTNFTENEIMSQMIKLPGYLKYDLVSWSIPMKGSWQNMRIRGMEVLGIDFDQNIEELYRKIYLTD